MLTRLNATIAATLAALYTLAGTAFALPGEGFGVEPYGIPTREAPAAADPVVEVAAAGMALWPFVLAAVIVVAIAVVAVAGYRAGAVHQRRLALH